MSKSKRPIGIDLFSGAGGMSLGFEQAGFEIVAAIDNDPIHAQTHAWNFPQCVSLCADLSQLSGQEIRSQSQIGTTPVDVLFGGPPCQGFSLIGKRDPDDPRNRLLYDFARLVNELKPRYFVVENVKGLLLGDARQMVNRFVKRVERAGYSIVCPVRTLNASHYGIPQNRERVFIIGYARGQASPSYPEPIDEGRNEQNSVITVWDAIGDLPNIDDYEELLKSDVYYGRLGHCSHYAGVLRGEVPNKGDWSYSRSKEKGLSGCLRTVHDIEIVKRFAATEPGTQEPISRFYRLRKDGIATTLRAGTGRSHGSFSAARPIHPIYPRCITVREAARLQSFPDWFRFHPTKWHGFRQVGNSAPPLLTCAVAKMIVAALNYPQRL